MQKPLYGAASCCGERRDAGEALTDIARTYGVSHMTIGRLTVGGGLKATQASQLGVTMNGIWTALQPYLMNGAVVALVSAFFLWIGR
jgi:hypothetical protein